MSRRELLIQGSSTLAVLAFFDSPLFAWGREGEETIPFLDQPPAPPLEGLKLLDWQSLGSWITPNEKFFAVGHYGEPVIDETDWRLEIGGWVQNPRHYTLDDIKALPKKEVVFTMECSGNSGFEWFQGGIGNAKWGGTPLAAILEQARVNKRGIEVIFFGADEGEEIIPYQTGSGKKIRDFEVKQNFARSMSLEDAMNSNNILCYEMNGEALPQGNGYPLRLIAPHWYGVSNVKWLTRIEVRATRYMGLFMADRYVTIREETRENGETVWTRTSVGKSLLKSMTAKVTVKGGQHRIYGAAWGTPVARVEVQVDNAPWVPAEIDQGREHEFAWKFWHLDWEPQAAGEHTITSRAIDTDGNVQPAMDDPRIAKKHTYWESNGQITRRIRIS